MIVFGGEKGVRTLDRLSSVPVFKTGAINQLDHLSMFDRHVLCYSTLTRSLLSITLCFSLCFSIWAAGTEQAEQLLALDV